jgi:hypothetical protein
VEVKGGQSSPASAVGRTHFGGAFLLLPAALVLSRMAERTLARSLGGADKARRLALSLFFRAALGIDLVQPGGMLGREVPRPARMLFEPREHVVGVAKALATGPRGTTAARHSERGANTPDRR